MIFVLAVLVFFGALGWLLWSCRTGPKAYLGLVLGILAVMGITGLLAAVGR
jgi:hypothetical protein